MRGDALVAPPRPSWEPPARVGYKVVCARFANGRPTGVVEDPSPVSTPRPASSGRPAGLLELGDGSILVVDDAAGVIWRVHR